MSDTTTDPALSGENTPPPAAAPSPAAAPAPAPVVTVEEPLGAGGKKVLEAERAARAEAEKRLAALKPLEELLSGRQTGQTKTDLELLNERLAAHEGELARERTERYRAEVAAAKGLSPELAGRLVGASREELAADADALLAVLPAPPEPAGPRNPAPDPSQGARGGQPVDVEALIADAQAKRDFRRVIALQKTKLANPK